MSKKILIFNSSPGKNQALFGIFEELKNKGFSFFPGRLYFLPKLKNKFNQILFIVSLPFWFFTYFLYLIYYKIKKINLIICLNAAEKIIITPVTKFLKIKIIWIEDSDSIILKNNITKLIFQLYKFLAKKVIILTFSGYIKNRLEQKKFTKENIRLINPGIKLNDRERQDNLFNELAQTSNRGYKRKFFTVGTIVDLNKKQKIENLFSSIKICQTVIPDIQLIIAGDGEERKSLSWLAKKMNLGDITWFVGEQAHLKKWLDSFDVFAVACETPLLDDIILIIKAMEAGLPVLGPKNFGLEKIIGNGECLFDEGDNEALAGKIIKLWRDKKMRARLGQDGRERVEKYFITDRMVEQLKKLL